MRYTVLIKDKTVNVDVVDSRYNGFPVGESVNLVLKDRIHLLKG